MNRLLVTFLCMALSSAAWAADGDIQKESGTGSTYAPKPPAALATAGEPNAQITVQMLCDGKASAGAGAFTCGPIWVPRGGVGYNAMIVRPMTGTSASGCGYDDVKIYTIQPTSGTCLTSAGNELPILGVLDDDGTSTPTGGVQQIIVIGNAPGPCLYAAGTATAGTCDATHTVNIVVDYYPIVK